MVHWQAVKRVLRYLSGTVSVGLHIKYNDRLCLSGFSDADWASFPDDRRSVVGYCVYFSDTLISWSSKKQHVVARSSTESEYRSLANLAVKMSWITSLLKDFPFSLPSRPIVWVDNLSAAALASNPVHHARTKHIEIDVHFVRDMVLRKDLEI